MRPIEKIRMNADNKTVWEEALAELSKNDPQFEPLNKEFIKRFQEKDNGADQS